ncbi:MAG: 3-deoxy-manno-octulosonate cytidylyltransferase [Rhizobiales bacterium]|nr:3-deoxy-manno-octulosonate cytidylyltransferase [Hyphomicrobiales bacterium]
MVEANSTNLILIPARMQATRLPGKPLKNIAGEPMIVHVWRRACEANCGPVVVATDDEAIAGAIAKVGGEAIMTRADHPSGSDRICEALEKYDPDEKFNTIINLQGDLPVLDPEIVRQCAALLSDDEVDISTLVAEITDENEKTNPNVVKMVGAKISETRQKALYFTRATAPYGDGPLYHHIGIYGYKRQSLERFISLPPSPLEMREKLEQLRALEAGMRIDVAIVETHPLGVDTPEDLEKARAILEKV